MADTTFTDGVTVTAADWFNDINDLAYTSVGITAGAPPASKAALLYLLVNGLSADASPDAEADYVTTLDASASTNKKVLLKDLTAFKVGSLTRDLTAASGNVATTGVGFKPKAVVFLAGFTSGTPSSSSIGVSTAAAHGSLGDNDGVSAGGNIISTSVSINIIGGVGTSQTASVNSMDSDGFTLAWTKTGSPSGTATIVYFALR